MIHARLDGGRAEEATPEPTSLADDPPAKPSSEGAPTPEPAPLHPDVQAFFLAPFLDELEGRVGHERAETILAEVGLAPDVIRDRTAWVSLGACEAFFARLVDETQDPAIFERCGRLAVTPRYAGVARSLLRALGKPMLAYRLVTESLTPRFNKVGTYEMEALGDTSVKLTYRMRPDGPRERSDLICRARAAQLGAIASMFDLPPARVDHPRCMHRGGDACVYELSWRPSRPRIEVPLMALAGALLGAAVGAVSGLDVGGALAVGALGAMTGAAFGWSRRMQRLVEERAEDVAEQTDDLLRAARASERRYEELAEAKAAVDRQVAERTAELRRTSEQLASTLEEVRALDQAKTDFFNNVSHELRTPLTLILGPLSDLAAGREPPGGTDEAIAVANRNATRLLTLINQLLDLARVDAGRERLALAPVDVTTLGREVVDAFTQAARRKDVRIRFSGPAESVVLPMDRRWVESAVTNLVANALRYTPAGGRVDVRVTDTGGDVTVEVVDDGPGLTAEAQRTIFERFAQAEGTQGGTGLGLAIVREAARLHGGRADVASRLGEGARFTLSFPRRVSEEAASPANGRAVAPVASPEPPTGASLPTAAHEPPDSVVPVERPTPAPSAPVDPRTPIALVVEDSDDLREHVAGILAARYDVRQARNGREGLEMAASLRPDVVVSDVSMPEMDGYELCRALRARDETRGTPVILVTARSDQARILEGFAAGADDYVVKPFHARELLARVEVHVQLRATVRELAHRERLAAIGVMAASVAHEVRNPLTAITSGLGGMRRRLSGKADEATVEMIGVLLECAGRIETITTDLMDLSRVDRAEVDHFSPGRGVRSAVRLARARASEHVAIDVEVDDGPMVLGRPGDLNHVFLNLVDNAVRAVGDAGTIRVRAGSRGDDVEVVVEDSGPGVPEEALDLIFQPFYTTRAAGEGTGLGLAIARQVVEQHGGDLRVGRSDLGGARFTVRIPATAAVGTVVG